MAEDVDVVVLGLGPGGENAAGLLADAGLRVVAVEARLVGGECPYFACVPTKMMARAADLVADTGRARKLAGDAEVRPDWTRVADRIRDDATHDWNDQAAVDRLTGRGVRLVRGEGVITGEREVRVGDEVFRAARGILLNTGTAPLVPPIEGLAGTPFWTNRDVVRVATAPESLLVLGGGVVGVETAQVFARFGTRVTIIEGGPRLVAREEPEAGDLLKTVFEREGIDVRTGTRVEAVEHDGAFTLRTTHGEVSGERLLVATGRRPNLKGIGLPAVGLDEDARALEVDGALRAGDGLWAIGDITGKGAFTHVSMYQSTIAVRDILGEKGPLASYRAVPRVTFTDPEIGVVGLTEAEARDQELPVRIGTTDLAQSTRGWIHGPGGDGFIKLVQHAEWGTLVGATVMGPMGGEVLGALAVAVHAEVPVDTLRTMIYAYPTLHRAIETALADLEST
ncbi:Dihydrolipoyl dehydrogenase [Actinomadura rubteroloni]|uniref:Dihydrolipoyl dehydrogenase n=1 Tax=Actinomadura rubteroloni TaxID=1926885 RepID=A0A2P4UJ68_9ACTN|nr:FAD-dependent oxidoreductase [Actinomadura rubteroloni]POM25115.1 Dihydrolipoyl dehydrogenase [Actinomadura rubteroloni]